MVLYTPLLNGTLHPTPERYFTLYPTQMRLQQQAMYQQQQSAPVQHNQAPSGKPWGRGTLGPPRGTSALPEGLELPPYAVSYCVFTLYYYNVIAHVARALTEQNTVQVL